VHLRSVSPRRIASFPPDVLPAKVFPKASDLQSLPEGLRRSMNWKSSCLSAISSITLMTASFSLIFLSPVEGEGL